MTLEQWIKHKGGPQKVARLLNCTASTVYYWLDGTGRLPSIKTMQKIERLSGYKVRVADMIPGTSK